MHYFWSCNIDRKVLLNFNRKYRLSTFSFKIVCLHCFFFSGCFLVHKFISGVWLSWKSKNFRSFCSSVPDQHVMLQCGTTPNHPLWRIRSVRRDGRPEGRSLWVGELLLMLLIGGLETLWPLFGKIGLWQIAVVQRVGWLLRDTYFCPFKIDGQEREGK